MRFLRGICCVITLLLPLHAFAVTNTTSNITPNITTDAISVTLLNPGATGNPFWDMLTRFMQAAAADLHINLEVLYGNDNRFTSTEQALQVLSRKNPPDYLVYNYFFSQGQQILQAAENAAVYSVLITTDIPARELADTGLPQGKYPHFLARIIPDDKDSGHNLANLLIDRGKQLRLTGDDNNLHMIAISGMRDSSATWLRNQGLKEAIAEHSDIRLHQLVYANWSADTAASQSAALLERYPQTRLIWTASDVMALAALEEVKIRRLEPGREILAVGTDWTAEALDAIAGGQLLASAGGHFIDGALALAVIYDHVNGLGPDPDQASIRQRMDIIQQNNLAHYRQLLNPLRWSSMNFHRLTRTQEQFQGAYPFDTRDVMQQLQPTETAFHTP